MLAVNSRLTGNRIRRRRGYLIPTKPTQNAARPLLRRWRHGSTGEQCKASQIHLVWASVTLFKGYECHQEVPRHLNSTVANTPNPTQSGKSPLNTMPRFLFSIYTDASVVYSKRHIDTYNISSKAHNLNQNLRGYRTRAETYRAKRRARAAPSATKNAYSIATPFSWMQFSTVHSSVAKNYSSVT